jgi:hypothetical protein
MVTIEPKHTLAAPRQVIRRGTANATETQNDDVGCHGRIGTLREDQKSIFSSGEREAVIKSDKWHASRAPKFHRPSRRSLQQGPEH